MSYGPERFEVDETPPGKPTWLIVVGVLMGCGVLFILIAGIVVMSVWDRVDQAAEDEVNFWDFLADAATVDDTDHFDEMIAEGRAVEAYYTANDKEFAFEYMADELYWFEDDTSQLKLLMAIHRRTHPQDIWLAFYDAYLLYDDEKWDEAAEKFRQTLPRVSSSEDREYFLDGWMDAKLAADRPLEAYRAMQSEDKEYAFEYLTEYLDGDADSIDATKALLAEHRKFVPNDPRLRRVEINLRFLEGRHEEVVRLLSAMRRTEGWEDDELWFEERQLRSFIKLGRLKEALTVAKRSTARDDDPYYEVVVYALMGDAANTIATAEECERQGYSADDFYSDDDAGPVLRDSAAMRAFRAKYPPE